MKLIREFLSRYSPSPLTNEAIHDLEAPLSLEEWGTALRATKPGKSPGPDGFTAQYYKCFSDLLAPSFLKAFNSLSTTPYSLTTLLEAYITVIPKDEKDPANVASYRPISLLNVDVKLFSKILAMRLSQYIPQWVGVDQVGFVPDREMGGIGPSRLCPR